MIAIVALALTTMAGAFALGSIVSLPTAVLSFVVVSALFPKFLFVSVGPEEMQVARIVDEMLVGAIVVCLWRNRCRWRDIAVPWQIRLVFVLTAGTYLVTTLFPLLLQGAGVMRRLDIPLARQVFGAMWMFNGLVLFYAAQFVLRSVQDIERLLRVLVALGVVATIEATLFFWTPLFPSATELAVHERLDRFIGLTMHSTDLVARLVGFAMLSVLYFVFVRGRQSMIIWLPLMAATVIATLTRGAILGVVAGITCFVYLNSSGLTRVAVGNVAVATGAIVMVLGLTDVLEALLRALRGDAFLHASILQRLAIWARAGDAFLFTFPWGAGAGNVENYMANVLVPARIPLSVFEGLREQIMTGSRVSSVHNLYLDYIAENGVLGIIVLAVVAWTLGHRFFGRTAWRVWALRDNPRAARFLEASLLSMLVIAAVGAMTDSTTRIYGVYFLIFTGLFAPGVWHRVGRGNGGDPATRESASRP